MSVEGGREKKRRKQKMGLLFGYQKIEKHVRMEKHKNLQYIEIIYGGREQKR